MTVKGNKAICAVPYQGLGLHSGCICQKLISIHLKFVHFVVYLIVCDFHLRININYKQISIFTLKLLVEICRKICDSLCNASIRWLDKDIDDK